MNSKIALMAGAAIVAFSQAGLRAQNFESLLSEIEANNTTLSAIRSESDAQRAEARVGIAPSDPTVEFGYLWGKGQGDRVDLSAMQEFDFPTVYYWRKKVSDGEISVIEYQYKLERMQILLEAKKDLIDLVYSNALVKELQRRLSDATAVSDAYQKQYDNGGASVLDLNKAKLNLLTATKQYESAVIEKEAVLSHLMRLNGGKPLSTVQDEFGISLLPEDFEQWFEDASFSSPELQALEAESTAAQAGVKLATSQWLPKFSLGYVSERQDGTSLQGVGGSISIPLWENRGKVRAAKAHADAAVARAEDARVQLYNSLKTKYNKAKSLQKVSSDYRQALAGLDSSDLLKKALESGQISLVEYILETNVWYEALVETLEAQRDCAAIEAEMNSWQL